MPTSEDVLDHAVHWNALLRRTDPPEFEHAVDRWLESFLREGIDRVVTGAVVLRRRRGPNWVRVDDGVKSAHSCGRQ